MATRTSVGTGAWSAAGTWDTGIPLDGDDVIIASGHTVTFDVDQSAFTTGVGITITGTLNHTTTTGTYLLKAKTGASIVGAGTWNIGTSGTPIPFAAKHTITGAAGWYVDGGGGLTMTVYGAEPSIKYVKLSADEAIGQTELSVDTDVTGDIWADGDIITINDINKAAESEERTIATGGIASGAITVTAGLTAAKSTGAYICLMSRNIKILPVTTTNFLYRISGTGKLTIASGEFTGATRIIYLSHGANVSGGTFRNGTRCFDDCSDVTISGGVFIKHGSSNEKNTRANVSGGIWAGNGGCFYANPTGTDLIISGGIFAGNGTVFNGASNSVITGGLFVGNGTVAACNNLFVQGGTFTSNTNGVSGTPLIVSSGTFTSNTSALSSNQLLVFGGTFTSNTRDLTTSTGALHNIAMTGTTEHYNYTAMAYYQLNCQSEDHDGSDGALKAWCKGGVVTSQVTVKPDGYTQAYLLDPESATYPVFFTKQFSVEPSKTVNVVVQLRKDASMTYLPRVYLMASIGNPLAGATPVDTFTMTDSTNTWESDTFTIANSTDYDQDYTLYFVAKNATDNAYAAYDITTEGGGSGGGISRSRLLGGV